jgi:cobalt/nickel transport system permease protein
MHVPDGFLDAPTSLATGAVAAVGVAVALRGARKELDDRTAPMAGLVATFVFAGQMMNFPVAAGTSGHLLGGALAAVLVGPWTAVLCVSVVLLVQALFMADGGITAIGTNITLMALVGVGVGWLVFVLARTVLPRRLASVGPAAAIAGFVSVPVAAVAFSLLFAVGGTAPLDLGTVLTAMVSWHLVIGVGEALITGLVVASVTAVRPDLVYGARPALAERELVIRPGVRKGITHGEAA